MSPAKNTADVQIDGDPVDPLTTHSDLHPAYCADSMTQVTTTIEHSREIAESTFLLRLAAPDIAACVTPGQFVMIRMALPTDPLIGRAFAVYDVIPDPDGRPHFIELVYIRKGNLTTSLADAPEGTEVTLWGPLGNGFRRQSCDELIIAVGGIGQTPMLLLGRDALGGGVNPTSTSEHSQSGEQNSSWAKNVTMIYGARRAGLLAGVDDFRAAGFDLHLCTDDGSAGTKQRVPDRLAEYLDQRLADGVDPSGLHVVTCGPEIMMQIVAEHCQERSIGCQVSMETPMACGIGICYSCVAKVIQPDGQWDYKRTCVEGPIFDAEKIVW